MATTVHIPAEVLDRVDARAQTLGISRNKFVVMALQKTLDARDTWSPEFLQALKNFKPTVETDAFVDEMMSKIRRARKSKRASPL